MRTLIGIVVTAVCAVLSPAGAQEYCVTCTGPDASYRCTIGGDPSIKAKSSRGQLLCITELARTGGHTSCKVGRTTDAPCTGEVRTVMFPQELEDPAAPPAADGALPPAPGMAGQPLPPPGAPGEGVAAPQEGAEPAPPGEGHSTVADLTKKTIDKTGEGIDKAGNAIGKAAKKTWKCLSSFFGDC